MSTDTIDELMGLTDADLDTRVRQLELQHRAQVAELACAIAVADARQLCAADGHRSMKGYLRATCNWSNAEVARMRGLARLIDRHPAVGEALLTGHIGGPQAFELAKVHGNRRVTAQFADFVPALLRHAEELSFDDFRVVVQRFVLLADPDGAHHDVDAGVEQRNAHVVQIDGAIDVRMTGGHPLVTAELLSIFNRFVDAEFHADLAARRAARAGADADADAGADAEQHDLPRTGRQRRHDAMVAIFRAAHAAVDAGDAADPLVNIVVDADTFARVMADAGLATDVDLDGRTVHPFTGLIDPDDFLAEVAACPDLDAVRCETTDGVPLHLHHVLRAALSGHVRRVVVDAAGVVVDQGRKQRLFTGAAREAALLLVRHCEHPGCDLPAEWCHVDHADEWNDGGVTDQVNARARCGCHNRFKHRRRLRSRRAATGTSFTIRPDGTIMLPVGARPPVFPDDEVDLDESAEIIRQTNAARRRLAASV